ncbi:MAG: flavin-containing monooxygenase, partial [Thermocrispum sp.]
IDLAGKRVAVIGTGASAVQIVPAIAPRVASLTVFQRSPAWVLTKPQRRAPGWLKLLFGAVPPVQRAVRAAQYWSRETTGVPMMRMNRLVLARGERLGRRHIARQVSDHRLREKLTPDYRFGCKRVLLSNDYYPALGRDNVELVTDGIDKVLPHALVDGTGAEHPVDTIIFATGFQGALQKVKIIGEGGRSLWRDWVRHGPQALRGVAVAGYPNLFFLHGPNSGSAHNSMVFMIEAQTRFVVRAIEHVRDAGAAGIGVRQQAQDAFQQRIQSALTDSVWVRGGCSSWYLDEHGVNRTMWPGASWRYRLETRTVHPGEFDLIRRK